MTEEACTHSYTGVLLDGYCSFHWPIYRIRARDARIEALERLVEAKDKALRRCEKVLRVAADRIDSAYRGAGNALDETIEEANCALAPPEGD